MSRLGSVADDNWFRFSRGSESLTGSPSWFLWRIYGDFNQYVVKPIGFVCGCGYLTRKRDVIDSLCRTRVRWCKLGRIRMRLQKSQSPVVWRDMGMSTCSARRSRKGRATELATAAWMMQERGNSVNNRCAEGGLAFYVVNLIHSIQAQVNS